MAAEIVLAAGFLWFQLRHYQQSEAIRGVAGVFEKTWILLPVAWIVRLAYSVQFISRWIVFLVRLKMLPSVAVERKNLKYGGNQQQPITVVLLSYKRPWNIYWILLGILKCPDVGRIIVSNNNPDIDLSSFLNLPTIDDDRLRFLTQAVHTKQGIRIELARQNMVLEKGQFFLLIDDDRFLLPSQITKIFKALRNDPRRCFGVQGFRRQYRDTKRVGSRWRQIGNHESTYMPGPSDCLFGVYAFDSDTLQRACTAASTCLGWHDLRNVGNGEDILLCLSCADQPRIVDVGHHFECASASAEDIATWVQKNFARPRFLIRMQLHVFRGVEPRDYIWDDSPLESITKAEKKEK